MAKNVDLTKSKFPLYNSFVRYGIRLPDGKVVEYETLGDAMEDVKNECEVIKIEHLFNCHRVQGMLFMD